LVIAYTYNKDKSILLLSPTKPLITQHYKSLIDLLDIPKEKIILLTGEIDPKKRKDLYKEKGIIICATPQTIDNDLNNNYIDSENFNLIIFDEAHRATKNYAYCNISKYFENDLKRLALTASPGFNKQKIEDVANNLKIDHIEIRTESDVDVVDYVKDVDIDTKYIDLDIHSKKIASLIDQLISKKIDLLQKIWF
jgi:Fanconi anemia group M protein